MKMNNIALLSFFIQGIAFSKTVFFSPYKYYPFANRENNTELCYLLPTTLANLFDIQDIYSSSTAFYYNIYAFYKK